MDYSLSKRDLRKQRKGAAQYIFSCRPRQKKRINYGSWGEKRGTAWTMNGQRNPGSEEISCWRRINGEKKTKSIGA